MDTTAHSIRTVGDFKTAPVFAVRVVSDRLWALIRAFVMRLDGSDIRARFGAQPNLADEATLRRFFGVPADAEIIWMEDALAPLFASSVNIVANASITPQRETGN